MIAEKTFRKGALTAEVLAPGLFRVQENTPAGKETVTFNANTDHFLWQEGEGINSVTIGLSRPFHLFTREDIEQTEKPNGEFNRIVTVDVRARELFNKGRKFLKQFAVTVGPDSLTQNRFKIFLDGIESRKKINPQDLKPGDTVALPLGDKKNRILLMKIVKTGKHEWGRFITYEGMMVERGATELRFTYLPHAETSSGRPIWENDCFFPIHPDELRQFYIPDNRTLTESTAYFEKIAGEREKGKTPQTRQFVSDYLKTKNFQMIGNVAI